MSKVWSYESNPGLTSLTNILGVLVSMTLKYKVTQDEELKSAHGLVWGHLKRGGYDPSMDKGLLGPRIRSDWSCLGGVGRG